MSEEFDDESETGRNDDASAERPSENGSASDGEVDGGKERLPPTSIERKQQQLAHHVRMVARKLSHALFVFGAQGGLGKSRTINQVLQEEGSVPVLINSHVTVLALYELLFVHRDEAVIFFDDVDSMFGSMPHLGLLRSALWGNPRIVTYSSSQLPKHLPQSFQFTSRCIFAANVIPAKNDAFKAVLSRCDQFELAATNGEVIEMMRALSANGFHGITADECETVIDFIEEHSDDRELSLRLLTPSLRKYRFALDEGIDWRPMIKSQLEALGRKKQPTKRLDSKTADLMILRQAMSRHPEAVTEQLAFWMNKTGKSRPSFYRTLKRLRSDD